ncbi:MAG: transporter permease [Thermoleophilia bacterium]|nr:transporter permease [Thermoleophilia bacterium]
MSRLRTLYLWLTLTSARRRDLLWSALFSSLLIAIITSVLAWLWVAALPGSESIAGYDAVRMVWYLAVAEAVVNGVDQRLMLRIGDDFQRGDLTAELLRPVTLVWMLTARELGRSVARFVLSLPACVAVAWLIVGSPPSAAGLALLVITGPLAVIVQTLLIVAASASVMWLGDANAAWFVMQKLVFLVGGMLLPLEFWPDGVSGVLIALPWAATAYVPAHLAVQPDLVRAIELVALQLFWVLAVGALASLAWTRGEQRLLRTPST